MSIFVECVRVLLKDGKITLNDVENLIKRKEINIDEYKYIIKRI